VLYEVHSAVSQLAYVGRGVRRQHGAKLAATLESLHGHGICPMICLGTVRNRRGT
jgi:hypothetical protein